MKVDWLYTVRWKKNNERKRKVNSSKRKKNLKLTGEKSAIYRALTITLTIRRMKVVTERFSLTFRENILAYTFHGNMKGHWLSMVRMLFIVILHSQNLMRYAFIINY